MWKCCQCHDNNPQATHKCQLIRLSPGAVVEYRVKSDGKSKEASGGNSHDRGDQCKEKTQKQRTGRASASGEKTEIDTEVDVYWPCPHRLTGCESCRQIGTHYPNEYAMPIVPLDK